jgi:hypothetical protein
MEQEEEEEGDEGIVGEEEGPLAPPLARGEEERK